MCQSNSQSQSRLQDRALGQLQAAAPGMLLAQILQLLLPEEPL